MSPKAQGDPAFRGSRAITHEPVIEEERPSPLPDARSLKRPFPWALGATFLAIAAVAVVAGLSVGWQYAIPFAVLAGLILFFVGFHRAQRLTSSESVPRLDFDQQP
jgi:Flp pilus assembly protein TadB